MTGSVLVDELQKFLFEGLPVRGMLVRLTHSWQTLLQRRASAGGYPAPVRDLLGEMAAASTLMHANLKFEGSLILQVHGDGPVKLAVAEARSDLGFRATATLQGDVPPDAGLEALVNAGGKGQCAITLDPQGRQLGMQPYQGIVPLHGDQREPLQQLSEVLEHYMLQSEQLDTKLILAANDQVAAGMLIQRLPVEGEGNLAGARNEDDIGLSEHYNRIAHLAATLTREELLTLPTDRILHRLFWEETVRVFEPTRPSFGCTCSADRVRSMLKGLGREEADSIIEERGTVEIRCEFCGQEYRYDAVDVGEMFTPARDQPPGSSSVQ